MLREEIIKGLKIATRKIGGCCDNGGWLDNDEALARKSCEEAIKLLEQEPCEMTAEEYRQRMIRAFHNADCGELVALVVLPTEKEFEHLEWLLEKHYKAKPEFCEDAISRQAVLDMMQMRMGSKELYKAVYELPPVTPQSKTGHWIPVNERLPEDFDTYLITLEDGVVCQCSFNPDFVDEDNNRMGAFTYNHQYFDQATLGMIDEEEEAVNAIAWMPFEPYKAESEE